MRLEKKYWRKLFSATYYPHLCHKAGLFQKQAGYYLMLCLLYVGKRETGQIPLYMQTYLFASWLAWILPCLLQ